MKLRMPRRVGSLIVAALLGVSALVAVTTVEQAQASASCSYVKSVGETRKVVLDHPAFGTGDVNVWSRGEVRYQDCKGAKGHRFVKVISTFAGYNVEGTEMDCSGGDQILHSVTVSGFYYDQSSRSISTSPIKMPCSVSTFYESIVKNTSKTRLYVCETRVWPSWRFRVVIDGNAPKYGGAEFVLRGTFPDTGEAGPFRHNC